ncbi:nucleotide disphospho-sugar-binding domain-containing protein, partial [Bacillus subtilis]
HFSVPLVVMPHDKDQPMVAQRLSELHAGYVISKDEVNAQILKQAVDEVLRNDQYTAGIKKINQSFKECMDMEEVMERIDELIRQKNK